MSGFDDKVAYVPQDDVFFNDGREIALLHFIYSKPNLDEIRGNPAAVLAAIDEFGRTKNFLMNVGKFKGKIVSDLIAETKPKVMVELGGYIGYSAILYADTLRKVGGGKVYCFEFNPEFSAVISSLVDLAGLKDRVEVIVGASTDGLRRLHAEGVLGHIDLMFLDHFKPAYMADLKTCEKLKLVGPGTVLAADNVIYPGNPAYLKYVRSSVEEKRKNGPTGFKPSEVFPDWLAAQYGMMKGIKVDENIEGDPNLIYESKLIDSFEPTGVPDGVEITKCVGIAK